MGSMNESVRKTMPRTAKLLLTSATVLFLVICMAIPANWAHATSLTATSTAESIAIGETKSFTFANEGSFSFTLDKTTTVSVKFKWSLANLSEEDLEFLDEYGLYISPFYAQGSNPPSRDEDYYDYEEYPISYNLDSYTITTTLQAGTYLCDVLSTVSGITYTVSMSDVSVYTSELKVNDLTIHVGETGQLTVTRVPGIVTESKLVYQSMNKEIATINNKNGVVTARSFGQTDIVITDECSGATTKAHINVLPPIVDTSVRSMNVYLGINTTVYGRGSYTGKSYAYYYLTLNHPTLVKLDITWDDPEIGDSGAFWVSDFDETSVTASRSIVRYFDDYEFSTVKLLGKGTHILTTGGMGVVNYEMVFSDVSTYSSSISVDDCQVYAGGTSNVVPVVSPSDVVATEFVYSSSNSDVAAINSEGVITGIKPGMAQITVTDKLSGATATLLATVEAAPINRVGDPSKTLAVGANTKLGVSSPVKVPSLSWSTSNKNVATVTSTGKVTAKHLGQATISATSEYGETISWTVDVTSQKVTCKQGKSLSCSTYSKYIKNSSKAKWKSSNKKIAKVSKNKITVCKTGKKGTATLSIKVGGKTYKVNLITKP